jgi:hypothetical protein
MKGSAFLVLACLASLLAVGPAFAAGPTDTEAAPAEANTPMTPSGASSLVVVWDQDAESFQAPTPQQRQRITDEINRLFLARFGGTKAMPLERDEVVSETLANGMVRARTPLSMMNMSVVRMAPDGEFVHSCAATPQRAGETVQTPVLTANPAPEVK